MRKVLISSLIFFLFFVYGLVISQISVSVVSESLKPSNPPRFFDYRGATNVHTNRGLGSGSLADVTQGARDAGLDYVVITDLNVFDAEPYTDSYQRQLLILSAAEYSYLESRLLVFDPQRPTWLESLGQAQVRLADFLSQTGSDADSNLLILAHPTKPGYTWTGPYPSGLDGLEVINLKSIWQRAWAKSKISFFWSVLIYPFNPQLALLRLYEDPSEELALWDQLSSERTTIGMAGVEATQRTGSIGKFFVRFPSYQTSFSLLSNHVLLRSELTGDVAGDRRKVLGALSEGQFYMSFDILGNPKGFSAHLEEGEKIYPIGSRVKMAKGMKIRVHLPTKPNVPFETAFIKDGQHIMSSNSVDTEYTVNEPGVYRIIVRVFPVLSLPDGQRWMTWIYTNPFYIE